MASTQQQSPGEAIAKLWQQAKDLQVQGKSDASLEVYRSILKLDDRHLPTLHQVAQIRESRGEFAEAIEVYQKAIEVDAEPPFWVYRHLGFSLSQNGELEAASEVYRQAIALRLDDVATYNLLGQVRGKLGDLEGAVSSYGKAIELQPEQPSWVYLNFAEALERQGHNDRAIAAYEKALALEPENQGIRRLLEVVVARKEGSKVDRTERAKELQQQGKFDEALAQYRAVLAEDGSNLAALHQVAKICESQSRWDEAVEAYRKAVEVDAEPPFWVYRHLGFALSQKGELEGAIEVYEKAVELNPEDETAQSLLGQVLDNKRNFDGVIKTDETESEVDTENPTWTSSSLDKLHRQNGQMEAVVAAKQTAVEFQHTVHLEPQNPELLQEKTVENWVEYAILASDQAEIANNDEAISLYEQAISLHPDRAWPYLKLADLYQTKTGRSESAVNLYFWALIFNKSENMWLEIYQNLLGLLKYSRLSRFISENRKYLLERNVDSIIGNFELCVGNILKGWAFQWDNLDQSVELNFFIDGKKINTILCNKFNRGLKKIGLNKGNYGFEVTIPDKYLNNKEYEIELKTIDNKVFLVNSFQLQIQGNIDKVNHTKVTGWIVDTKAGKGCIDLDVYVNGSKYQSIIANLPRDDVKEIFGVPNSGFYLNLDPDVLRGKEVVLTLKNSCLPILDTPILALTSQSKINTISLLNQKIEEFSFLNHGEKQWLNKILFPELKKRIRHNSFNEKQLLHDLKCNQLSWWESKLEAPINVIVPVYRNLEITKKCLERVIHCKCNKSYQVTVINDCSPEPDIHTYLYELEKSGKINLIQHEVNQGFPTSVNDGMKFDPNSDVVLLNSDAYVTDYWLDRLHESVYQESKVATGTAFSNNATIFSYPVNCQETEDIPDDLTLEELAEVFYEVNKNKTVQVPSGHGFCLYIRREALREVGYFDAATWGKGYGEEVDWCQKALDLGWRHVAATGVFVQHVGSQSFVGDKTDLLKNSLQLMRERYPEYDLVVQDFIKSDPLAEYRRNVDLARLKRCGHRFILTINHSLGGGTEKHFKDMANLLESENLNILMLQPDSSEDWVQLMSPKFKLDLQARYDLKTDFNSLIRDLQNLGVFHVHLHHVIGFTEGFIEKLLKSLELSYDFTLHDYVSICPRINLSQSEGQYCQEPPIEFCELCIQQYGVDESLQKSYQSIGSVKKWIFKYEQLLQGARKIFVPSQDMSNRMLKHFPTLKFTVRPHPESRQTVTLHSHNEHESTVRVGLIGGISPVKGLKTLYDCATYAAHVKKDIEFIVIGTTANNNLFENFSNVTIYGSYKSDELQELITNSSLDFAAFFSTWPETYCYTLSEALENSLYPFAFDLGAIGDRIRELGVGCLISYEANIATLVDSLYNFGYQCREQRSSVTTGNKPNDFSVSSYYDFNVFIH